jgi:hypothetical protein
MAGDDSPEPGFIMEERRIRGAASGAGEEGAAGSAGFGGSAFGGSGGAPGGRSGVLRKRNDGRGCSS